MLTVVTQHYLIAIRRNNIQLPFQKNKIEPPKRILEHKENGNSNLEQTVTVNFSKILSKFIISFCLIVSLKQSNPMSCQ
jgi:hypothetical protein